MNVRNNVKVVFTAIFLFAFGTAFAQNPLAQQTSQPAARAVENPGASWKKQVARLIDMGEKLDTLSHHLHDMSSDTSLFEMIVNAIDDGRLIAYSPVDNRFSTKLSKEIVDEMVSSRIDTVMIQDPSTTEWTKKVVTKDFNYESIHKYRIMEEWTFNIVTGKTKIQVLGIAPSRDLFTENGDFIGVQNMFWLQFNDMRPILDVYEQYHPDNTMASRIWNDYFKNDGKMGIQR